MTPTTAQLQRAPVPERPTRPVQSRFRHPMFLTLLLIAATTIFFVASNARIVASMRPYLHRSAAEVPERPVAIIFGALVYPSGELSPVLRARVEAGIRLYREGKVRKLLMTGDNGTPDYDEVTAMKDYAVKRGIPARDVVRDYAGFRTYDSCYRARDVFAIDAAVLVTQEYHLSRALYLARKLGIDAVGYAAPPNVSERLMRKFRRREFVARAGAVVDLLTQRRPRFLGPREPLFQNEHEER